MQQPGLRRLLIFGTCLIVPFANDIYIPALPDIARAFPGSDASLILSIFLLGLALSQLIYGPLLDRFGRKPVLTIGIVLYTLASVLVMTAVTFNMLLIARFIQAIGACSAFVSVMAILRDVYPKSRLVHATGVLMTMVGLCPALAPLLGGVLTHYFGWRSNFVFLFLLGVFFSMIVISFLRETIKEKNLGALNKHQLIGNYVALIANRFFLRFCICSALSYGVLFAYFTFSSHIIIEQLGYNQVSYGLILAINAIAILGTALLAPRLASRMGLAWVIILGTGIVIVSGVFMIILNALHALTLFTFMGPMFIATLGIGLVRPTASAGAMGSVVPTRAGTAAAGYSFSLFVGGSLATIIAGILVHQVVEFGVFMLLLGSGGFLFAWKNRQRV